MNATKQSPLDEDTKPILAPSSSQNYSANNMALRFIAFHKAIGALLIVLFTLVPILGFALRNARLELEPIESYLLMLSGTVVVFWPFVVLAGLYLLEFDYQVLRWGANWRGLRWVVKVGVCVALILGLNLAVCGYFAGRMYQKLIAATQ